MPFARVAFKQPLKLEEQSEHENLMSGEGLRVCHIVTGDGWGGAERVVSVLLGAMVRQCRGIQFQTVLFNDGQLAKTLALHGLDTHIIPETGRSFISLCLALRKWLSSRQVDVLHVHRYNELAAALIATLPSVPAIVVTVHGLQPWSQLGFVELAKCWVFMILARCFGGRFVAVSQELEGRLIRVLGRSRVNRIVNPLPPVTSCDPVDDIRRKFGWAPSKKLVGFVGRLEVVKGPDLFVEVAKMCPGDIGFVVVGGGAMEEELRRTSQADRAESPIRFLGPVPDATPYLRQFDVLALTSRHEGLPMVVLEAASNEVPVVAFDVGGVKEVVDGKNGTIAIPFGDVQGFVEALKNILDDREQIRKAVRLWAQSIESRFSLEAVVDSYLAVYKAAVRSHKIS